MLVSFAQLKRMEKTTDKQELRERIVAVATMLFQRDGIKQVRMDDVASELGVSKKTLYGVFADKEAILFEVVKMTTESLSTVLCKIVNSDMNVLEQIFMLYKRIVEHIRGVNPLFFIELIRYAEVEAYSDGMYFEHTARVKEWLQKGVKQGLLRDDINYEVFLQQDGFQIDKLLVNPAVREYEPTVIYNSVVLVLLRGMATEKGLEIINSLNTQ